MELRYLHLNPINNCTLKEQEYHGQFFFPRIKFKHTAKKQGQSCMLLFGLLTYPPRPRSWRSAVFPSFFFTRFFTRNKNKQQAQHHHRARATTLAPLACTVAKEGAPLGILLTLAFFSTQNGSFPDRKNSKFALPRGF